MQAPREIFYEPGLAVREDLKRLDKEISHAPAADRGIDGLRFEMTGCGVADREIDGLWFEMTKSLWSRT